MAMGRATLGEIDAQSAALGNRLQLQLGGRRRDEGERRLRLAIGPAGIRVAQGPRGGCFSDARREAPGLRRAASIARPCACSRAAGVTRTRRGRQRTCGRRRVAGIGRMGFGEGKVARGVVEDHAGATPAASLGVPPARRGRGVRRGSGRRPEPYRRRRRRSSSVKPSAKRPARSPLPPPEPGRRGRASLPWRHSPARRVRGRGCRGDRRRPG